MPSSFWTSASVSRSTLTVARRAQLLGQLEAIVVDVGDDDVAGADMADDRGRHRADRAGAGDQHVLADHVQLQRGVDGVAERIEDRGDVEIDAVGVVPDIGIGNGDIFGEGAGAVDADAAGVRAQVPPAGHAVAAAAADDVALAARRSSPGVIVVDVLADLDDLADEFVADHHRHGNRLLRPLVPFVDVQVGAADARCA